MSSTCRYCAERFRKHYPHGQKSNPVWIGKHKKIFDKKGVLLPDFSCPIAVRYYEKHGLSVKRARRKDEGEYEV